MFALPWRPRTVVALAAVVSHATALWGGFVWLDHAHLTAGLALVPLRSIGSAFLNGFAGTGFYRPLMSVSLSLDAALGATPFWFHAVSLAWHAAATVLVLVAAQTLGASARAAFFAALVFAVHPVGALVTGAIAFRSEAMIACALLALVAFHQQRRAWAAALALLLGGLTKETALALAPLFIVALELHNPSKRWKLWLYEGAAFSAALLARVLFSPVWRSTFAPLSASQAIGTRLAALAKTAFLAAFPLNHTICDAFPRTSALSATSLCGGAVLVGLVLLAWRQRGASLLLLISLLPSLHLVPIMRWWSPHYLYVPLAFGSMVVANGLERLWAKHTRWVPLVAIAVIALLSMQSLSAGLRYRTDLTLWRPEVTQNPGCREGHFYLGEAARAANQQEAAADHYEAAIVGNAAVLAYVDQGAAMQNLGVVRLSQSRFGDAVATFRAALTRVADPWERRQLTHNLATAELRTGNYESAESLLRAETQRQDAQPASLFVRAHALARLGRQPEAEDLMARYKNARH